MRRFPNVTTWTGIFPDLTVTRDGWLSFSGAMKEFFQKFGGRDVTIAEPIITKLGNADFKAQIYSLMSSPSNGLWTNLFANDGITFYQQAKQFELAKKFQIIIDASLDIDLPKTLKKDVPTNVWTSSYWHYGAYQDNALSKDLVRTYEKISGNPNPSAYAGTAHTAVLGLAAAISAAGSTETDKVIAALEGMKFESVRGPVYYRKEDHQLISQQCLVQWAPSDQEPGWKTASTTIVEDAPIVNPPEPGKKWNFK